jgi:hypothetical protein
MHVDLNIYQIQPKDTVYIGSEILILMLYHNTWCICNYVIRSFLVVFVICACMRWIYRIAGNFRGVQFSRMAGLQSFRGLIFADAGDHAHYTLYNCIYFAGLIFADSRLSAKTTKIRPHENFLLYGS